MTRRLYQTYPEEPHLEVMDHTEHALRTRQDEAVLAALEREHPERATQNHPPGTKAPRRLLPPVASSLTTNFD
jgi:hypothetical protein